MSDLDKVAKGLSDLIIADTFIKHGISDNDRRPLTPDQKQQIHDLVEDLKRQVDQFVKGSANETPNDAPAATAKSTSQSAVRPEPTAPRTEPSAPRIMENVQKKRPRLTLRKNK